MTTEKEWWGADVVPRIQWRIALPKRRIAEGDVIPDGYGIAYYVPDEPITVVMPIPLNLIVGAWRALMWWMKCPPWRFVEWREERAFERGRRQGRREALNSSGRTNYDIHA